MKPGANAEVTSAHKGHPGVQIAVHVQPLLGQPQIAAGLQIAEVLQYNMHPWVLGQTHQPLHQHRIPQRVAGESEGNPVQPHLALAFCRQRRHRHAVLAIGGDHQAGAAQGFDQGIAQRLGLAQQRPGA